MDQLKYTIKNEQYKYYEGTPWNDLMDASKTTKNGGSKKKVEKESGKKSRAGTPNKKKHNGDGKKKADKSLNTSAS